MESTEKNIRNTFLIYFLLVIFVIVSGGSLSAQSLKSSIKQAQANLESGRYFENLSLLEEALLKNPKSPELVKLKILTYSGLEKKSIADSLFSANSSIFRNREFINFYVQRCFEFGKYEAVLAEFRKSEFQKQLDLLSWDKFFKTHVKLHSVDSLKLYAIAFAEKFPKFYLGWYYQGYYYELSRQLEPAVSNYSKAMFYVSFTPEIQAFANATIYAGMARLSFAFKAYEDCLKHMAKVFEINPDDLEMNLLSARLFMEKGNYNDAQEYLNRSLAKNPENPAVIRTLFYNSIRINKPLAALTHIRHLEKIIPLNDTLLYDRAKVLLQNKLWLEAYNDFTKLKKSGFYTSELDNLIRASKIDRNAPWIKVLAPTEDTLYYGIKTKIVTLSIKVEDQTGITSFAINDSLIKLNSDTSFEYTKNIVLNNYRELVISARDAFDNVSKKIVPVVQDFMRPSVEILYPIVENKNALVPSDPADKSIYLELKLYDNNSISALWINGEKKNIVPKKELKYLEKINVPSNDTITLRCEDDMGNESVKTYYIDRKKARENLRNPMGKTYVIIISNTKYKNFKELNGPKEDGLTLRSALNNYQIDSVIQKENVSLENFRDIFTTQIPLLINKYHVQSLLIWYGGHGTYSDFHNSGYWIPVEGTPNDADTYYSLTEMKIALAACKKLTHLLVISDACQTGPSFYTKSIVKNISNPCSDWEITKMRSSECFTSSDNQLSSDNSIFAKAFSRVLLNNPASCMGITSIAEKVTEIVKQNQQQKPIFGTITGMESENGSFVFIKRSFVEGNK